MLIKGKKSEPLCAKMNKLQYFAKYIAKSFLMIFAKYIAK